MPQPAPASPPKFVLPGGRSQPPESSSPDAARPAAAARRDADARLAAVRAGGHPGAGGLVVASDKRHAARLAQRLAAIAGERPEVVTSDEPEASARIAAFGGSRRRWLVSVLMVCEGVDIPRLRVGVYATAARTELFFRQVIGRFVRRTPAPPVQMSYLFMPADPGLRRLAAGVEAERSDALDGPSGGGGDPAPERVAAGGGFEAQLRGRALSALVSALSERSGEAHKAIHARVNHATGARSVSAATVEQLERANALLRAELRAPAVRR